MKVDSKKHKTLVIITSSFIAIVLLCMFCGFMLIKDVSSDVPSGDYAIVVSKQNMNLPDQMNIDSSEIKKSLDDATLEAKIFTTFDPDLPAYDYVDGSKWAEPYKIQVCDDEFLKEIGIENPERNTLYRRMGESEGQLDISMNISNKKSNFIIDDFVVYPLKAVASLDDEKMPNVVIQQQYLKFGDYITMETFEDLLQSVYKTNASNYEYSEFAQYYIIVKGENQIVTQQIYDLLNQEYNVVLSADIAGPSVFDTWRNWNIAGAISIILAIVFLISLRKFKKRLERNKENIYH